MSVVLSEHLPLLASAPDGIKKLRGLILELAVRGKLVPQDPEDEPASELLKRIAAERARQISEGRLRKSRPLPTLDEDEKPFLLPIGWSWIRLGEIGDWGAGATPLRSNSRYYGGSIPWFKSGELTADFICEAEEQVTDLALKECSLRKNSVGDVLIAMYGATIGKTAILAIAATTNQAVCACTPNSGIFNRYLLLLLKALKPNFIGQGAGGAQPNISREKIIATVTALPPEAEQHRIVAKVDELMTLCDRLEAEQADADTAHARLVESLLGTLTQSADADELGANWQLLAGHFDTLFATDASLNALKQTILQLAVTGRLVPQDPKDEPANEILKRIAVASCARKKNPASRPPDAIDSFALPHGWSWVTLPDLCGVGGGATPSKAKSAYWGDGLPWVSPKDMKTDWIADAQDHVTHAALTETRLPLVPAGSLLIVVRGMILVHSFPVAITLADVTINQDMKSLTPLVGELAPFLATALKGFKASILALVARSTHGTCKLESDKIFSFRFGLPPLAEQHRIVAKVDELMALCDQLKADLVDSRSRQARLADTLIAAALEAA